MLLHLAGRCFYLARCSPSPRLLDRLSPAGRPSEVLVARVQLTSAQTALHAAARRRRARAHASLVRQKLVGTDVLILLLEIGLAAPPVVFTPGLLLVQSAHSQSQFSTGQVWGGG
jgi:hypothetical protein